MNTPSKPAQTFKVNRPSLYMAGFSGVQTGPAGAGAGNDLAVTVQNGSAGLTNADSSIVEHPLYSMAPPPGYPAGAATTGYAGYTPAAYSHGAPVVMVDPRKESVEVRDCMARFIRLIDLRDAQHEQDEARFKELEENFQTRIAELEARVEAAERASKKDAAEKRRAEAESKRLSGENAKLVEQHRKNREFQTSVSAGMARLDKAIEEAVWKKESKSACRDLIKSVGFPVMAEPDEELDFFGGDV